MNMVFLNLNHIPPRDPEDGRKKKIFIKHNPPLAAASTSTPRIGPRLGKKKRNMRKKQNPMVILCKKGQQ